jgi:hypothetical protein
MDAFLGQLRREDLKEWQLEQARQPVTTWRAWSGRRTSGEPTPAPRVAAAADGSFDPGKVLAVLEHTLRLRHYSPRTLGTYMDWARRYLEYLKATNQVTPAGALIMVSSFQNFISHLATRMRVSSSTQNQAFSSLLFLLRDVLGMEVGVLENTVRAKRGEHLPTVLSVDEVRRLFVQMSGTPRLMAELIYGGGLRIRNAPRRCERARPRPPSSNDSPLAFENDGRGPLAVLAEDEDDGPPFQAAAIQFRPRYHFERKQATIRSTKSWRGDSRSPRSRPSTASASAVTSMNRGFIHSPDVRRNESTGKPPASQATRRNPNLRLRTTRHLRTTLSPLARLASRSSALQIRDRELRLRPQQRQVPGQLDCIVGGDEQHGADHAGVQQERVQGHGAAQVPDDHRAFAGRACHFLQHRLDGNRGG